MEGYEHKKHTFEKPEHPQDQQFETNLSHILMYGHHSANRDRIYKSNYLTSLTELVTYLFVVSVTYRTRSTVKEPSFIPRARWIPSVLTAAQRMGSSILHRAIKAWSIKLQILK